MPKVTVLMPVYNAHKYLKESIESVLNQTFTDFEFLIINDGSTDKSVEIIESFKDERIRLVHNEKNMNLVPTLNRGLELAKGEYIARMDADDICLPHRFKTQVEFMDMNLNVGVCGSWIQFFDGADYLVKYPVFSKDIKSKLLFANAIAHPTVMIRASMLKQYNLKYELNLAEDYDLWKRASRFFDLHNIPEVLLNYRISAGSYSNTYSPKVTLVILELIKNDLKELGIDFSEEILNLHRDIGNQSNFTTKNQIQTSLSYLKKILKANSLKSIYPKVELKKLVIDYMLSIVNSCMFGRKYKLKQIFLHIYPISFFNKDVILSSIKLLLKK